VESLPYRVQQAITGALKDALAKAQNPLLVLSNGPQYLTSQFEEYRVSYMLALPVNLLRQIGHALSDSYSKGVTCHTSASSGAGKTFNVLTAAAKLGATYVHVPVNNDLPPADLIDRIDRQIAAHQSALHQASVVGPAKLLLHFDLTDSISAAFCPVVFNLAFLGLVVDSSGSLFAWDPALTSLAFEVSSGPLIGQLSVCTALPQAVAQATSETFVASAAGLRRGMDWQFDTGLGDGTVTAGAQLQRADSGAQLERTGSDGRSGAATATAHDRLQYVAAAFATQQRHGGGFPYDFAEVLELERELDGETCLALLLRAGGLERRASLWCVHAFVNVVYWQLRDMHMPDSPLDGVTMPDLKAADPESEKLVKEQIKGQLVNFVVRTAREFATRQTGKLEPKQIVGMTTAGFRSFQFNGSWKALDFDEGGHPVFYMIAHKDDIYMYFRTSMNGGNGGWVIDDVIEASGGIYSSSDGPDLEASRWSSSPGWVRNPELRVVQHKDKAGYNGLALKVSGSQVRDNGHENGIYLLQSPYDNIGDKGHFIKPEGSRGGRRHLFWNDKDNCWQIAPQCNDDEGAYALSDTADFSGDWFTMPEDSP
jgi:hypothetical protein